MSQGSIFISYRREDSEGQAGRLYEGLAAHFGEDRVFMDVAVIRAGRDFRREIEERVAGCAVLLTVIGRQWLEARNAAGQRRVDDPADFVRLETSAALARPDITVVPVLVGGARMPEAEDLPAALQDMAFRNAVPLTHQRWDSDLEVLIADIEDIMQPAARADAGRGKRPGRRRRGPGQGLAPGVRLGLLGLGVVAAAALALIGFKLFETNQRLGEFQQQATAAATAASAAEAAALAARAKEEAARAEAAVAAASAAAAQQALADAETRAQAAAAAQATAEEQARAERDAAQLREAQERAAQESQAKAAAAEATRVAAEDARKAAAEQSRRSEEARLRLNRAAPAGGAPTAVGTAAIPATTPATAVDPRSSAEASGPGGQLNVPNWPLRAGCGGSDVNVTGTASFRIQPQGSGVLVRQRYSGSGGGYTAEFTGQQVFERPQASYEMTARGEFKGPRSFNAAWTVRIDARGGSTPASARGLRFQSEC